MKKRYMWVVVLLLLLVGCRAKAEPLMFAAIPSDDSELLREGFEPFVEYLSDCVGIEIKFLPVSDYAAVVIAMKYDRVDIARFGSFGYIQAAKEAGAEAICRGTREATGQSVYYSVIVARTDRHIRDLTGVSFAYVDPGSTSGYLAPTLYIQEEDIELGEIVYAGGHPQALMAVQNGTVDAAACSEVYVLRLVSEGLLEEGELEILWRSEPIPQGPIAVVKTMGRDLKLRLQKCIVATPRKMVEELHINQIGYNKATDSDYDVVRRMAEYR